MNCYAIIAQDNADTLEKRLENRSSHLARLQQLANQGRLILAGPHPSDDFNDNQKAKGRTFTGSLIVAKFSSLEAAQSWADQDPYVLSGVYSAVTVKPFIRALP